MRAQGINNRLDIAVNYISQIIPSQANPVIRHPALGKIVGSDPFAAVTAAHLVFAVSGNFCIPLQDHGIQEPGP